MTNCFTPEKHFECLMLLRQCAQLLEQVHGQNVFGFGSLTHSPVGTPITMSDPGVLFALVQINRTNPELITGMIENVKALASSLESMRQQIEQHEKQMKTSKMPPTARTAEGVAPGGTSSICNSRIRPSIPRCKSAPAFWSWTALASCRWLLADSRASILTGAPRAATSPANALRNYTFACVESEARLALLAHGCDPQIGVPHADQRNRDSLALDAMEPVRADVDAFLLDLLEDRVFTARDFAELPNGICRIAAPLTHELALTLPHWRECLRPIAANLAQTFREALVNPNAAPRIRANSRNKRRPVPGPAKSSLLATPRKTSQPRPYATRKWRTPTVEARPASPIACEMCGGPVLKRRRRHCEMCMPRARREHGLRAIEAARKALAAQTAAGNDPRHSAAVNRARGEAISEGHRRNRSWAREHPGQRDETWFRREIVPKLDVFTLAEIAAATGLSLAACSRIRAGIKVPHARHWEALAAVVRA